MPNLRELEGWYTSGQAAHALGFSRQAVIDLARDGFIRAAQVGKAHPHGRPSWVYDPDSVEAYRVKREERLAEKEARRVRS